MKSIKDLLNFDKQCLLCKYKYDRDACFDATYNHDFHCRSLSNIYYGKILELPVIKQIYNIYSDYKFEKEVEEYRKYYIDEYETQDTKWIWGLKSYDDLSGKEACMHTMNDIDIIYLKNENKYVLGIETIYMFDDEHGKYSYIKYLLDKFTEFMEQNGYDTTKEFCLYKVFTEGININTHFDSIEDCYAAFKMFVNGFCSFEKGAIKFNEGKRTN